MPIKILMAIPTLNQYQGRLLPTLYTVTFSSRLPDKLLIVDNGRMWHKQSYAEEMARSFELDVFTPAANLGVSGSVNYALRNTPKDWWWLHCNDDVDLHPECIAKMVEFTRNYPLSFIIPEHGEGSAFTVFLAPADIRDRVGYFDEQFFPSYLEDNDYGRRMNACGIRRVIVPGAEYYHHTSSTLKAYSPERTKQHHDEFRANMQRYVHKWGGEPEHERYEIPYNGARGHTTSNMHLWHMERL